MRKSEILRRFIEKNGGTIVRENGKNYWVNGEEKVMIKGAWLIDQLKTKGRSILPPMIASSPEMFVSPLPKNKTIKKLVEEVIPLPETSSEEIKIESEVTLPPDMLEQIQKKKKAKKEKEIKE
jgi:hypothetical protein